MIRPSSFVVRAWLHFFAGVSVLVALQPRSLFAQVVDKSPVTTDRAWQVPTSRNLMPHFEDAERRKVLYVDGQPFTVLAVEIPWWDLIYGRYNETETAYDSLYPAAEKIGLNALKVPIKWSMVEPEKGGYDFSYIDHAKSMAE